MSSHLRSFLVDAYESRRVSAHHRKVTHHYPIQIDDQDDSDKLNEFCNIFCTVSNVGTFRIELIGRFPISKNMEDLVEIYNGFIDREQGRLSLRLTINQIEVLTDLAAHIRKTSFMGKNANNLNWLPVSARTISSLYRFVRIIKEYRHSITNAPILTH